MASQNPNPADESKPAPAPGTPPAANDRQSRREARQADRAAWREQRRSWRRSWGGEWIGGLILIALGAVFLLQNVSGIYFHNWWAIFLLIPGLGLLLAAWNIFSNGGGQLRASFVAPLVFGLFMTLLAVAFFFDLDLRWIGPGLLILLGVGLLFVGWRRLS